MSSALARRHARSPSMAHRFLNPSIDNLLVGITLNSITVLPTLRYKAKDATLTTWPAWTYGPTLNLQDGTAPTINFGSIFHGANDDSVIFATGGGYYQDAANTNGNVGTNDVIIEALIRQPHYSQNRGIISKYIEGTTLGWQMSFTQSGANWYIVLAFRNGSNLVYVSPLQDASLANSLTYIFAVMNNSGDATATALRCYINNSLANAAVGGTWGGVNLDNTASLQIGNARGFGAPAAGLLYFAQYQQADWVLDSGGSNAEIATVAADRFNRLFAFKSWVARGAQSPTSIVKAAGSYIDKYETGNYKAYFVGPGILGIQSTSTTRRGLLVQPQRQNKILQSRSLGTTWTQVALTSISNDSGVGIDGTQYLDGIVGTADDTQHGITQDVTLTAAKYCLSCAGHPGDKNWIYLFDSTVANCWAYFDLANGVVGSKGAGCTAGIIPKKYIGDNYIPFIIFDGTAASHTLGAYAAHADGDNDFAGDAATVNLHLGDFQCEQGTYPTSRIITTTSMVTRAAATLSYTGQYNIGEGEGGFRAWIHAPAFTPDAQHTIFCASVAGAVTDLIRVYVDTDGAIKFSSACTGGNAGAGSVATNICTEREVELLLNWRKNQMNICVAGTWGTADTSVDIPAAIDRINLCCDNAGGTQLGSIELLDYKIDNKYQASWWDRGGGFTHNA